MIQRKIYFILFIKTFIPLVFHCHNLVVVHPGWVRGGEWIGVVEFRNSSTYLGVGHD